MKFFAIYKELMGKNSIMLVIPEKYCVNDLKKLLLKRYPELEQSKRTLIFAINNKYVAPRKKLKMDDIVSVILPASGG